MFGREPKNLPKIESLRFEGLTFKHEDGDYLFHNVDFDFPMNEISWVKASSGSGRSTLLQMIAGLQVPTGGKYFINNLDVCEMTFEEFLPYRLAIGYSFDYGGLLSNRTILDNLLLPLQYHKICGEKEANETVHQFLNYFNLEKYKLQRPSHVPGGVRKIVCLIRSVIMRPQILLLDDPSVGLSSEALYQFIDLITKMREEGAAQLVLMSSFDEKFMAQWDYNTIQIDEKNLYLEKMVPDKKVVHL